MAKQKSKYAGLLRSHWFVIPEGPNEISTAIKDVPQLPNRPIYFVFSQDDGTPLMTIVLDEVGECWIARGKVDLSSQKFEDYWEFCERAKKQKDKTD